MSKLGKKLIKNLKQLRDDLKSGKPLKGARVERFQTPDGPMHVRTQIIIRGKKSK